MGVFAVLVLVLAGAFAVGCGGSDDGATQEQLDAAKEEGAKEARQQAKLQQLQDQVKELQNQAQNQNSSGSNSGGSSGSSTGGSGTSSSTTGTGPVSSCTDGVQVGSNTSCAFAMNVAGEYGSNPGATSIRAYSPVTGEYYVLACGPWTGGGTVCVGGNGASVYLP
mgnify:CR=1 FL=1